ANERSVMEIFQQIHDRGQTIVMVTHDPTVGRRADRQIPLEHGRVAGEFLTQAQDKESIDERVRDLWVSEEGEDAAYGNWAARGSRPLPCSSACAPAGSWSPASIRRSRTRGVSAERT